MELLLMVNAAMFPDLLKNLYLNILFNNCGEMGQNWFLFFFLVLTNIFIWDANF